MSHLGPGPGQVVEKGPVFRASGSRVGGGGGGGVPEKGAFDSSLGNPKP